MPDLLWPIMVMSLALARAEAVVAVVVVVGEDPLVAMCMMTANVPHGDVKVIAPTVMFHS